MQCLGRELYVDVNFDNMMGVSQLCNDSVVELVCLLCVRTGHVQRNNSLSVAEELETNLMSLVMAVA